MSKQNLILPKGVLNPPTYFSENQLIHYKYFADRIEEKGLVDSIDSQAILNLAIMADLRDQYNTDISENGLNYTTEGVSGTQTKPNPSLQLMHAATKSMADRMKEYGLTPKTQGGRPREEKKDAFEFGAEPMKVATR